MKSMSVTSRLLLTIILTFSCRSNTTTNGKDPGDYWVRMSKSQRVNYLVGYSQGVDTGVDGAPNYKGSVFDKFLNSTKEQRTLILNKATELYKGNENRVIDWKSILISAFSELNGESNEIIEERLLAMRALLEPHLGQKENKPGDYWLLLTQTDQRMYLEGLISGIRTGIVIDQQNDSELKAHYEGLFNTGVHIERVADIVTAFYERPSNRIITYRFLFPIAYLKFSKVEESIINKKLEELRVANSNEN